MGGNFSLIVRFGKEEFVVLEDKLWSLWKWNCSNWRRKIKIRQIPAPPPCNLPLKKWEMTPSLLMWPWPERIVNWLKPTRWSWQAAVHKQTPPPSCLGWMTGTVKKRQLLSLCCISMTGANKSAVFHLVHQHKTRMRFFPMAGWNSRLYWGKISSGKIPNKIIFFNGQ